MSKSFGHASHETWWNPPSSPHLDASCEALSDSATSAGSDIVPWTATSDGSPRPGGTPRKKTVDPATKGKYGVCIYIYDKLR